MITLILLVIALAIFIVDVILTRRLASAGLAFVVTALIVEGGRLTL